MPEKWRGVKVAMVCKCSYCENLVARKITLGQATRILAGKVKIKCPFCLSSSRWKLVGKEVSHAR